MRSVQKSADAERVLHKTIRYWGVLWRGVSQLPRCATILYRNAVDMSIEAIERHRVSLLASESGSPTHILFNATTFTNNAG